MSLCINGNCTSTKICNPATNRCVLRTGKIGKLLVSAKPTTAKPTTAKLTSTPVKGKCKKNQVLTENGKCKCINPLTIIQPYTKNCVSRTGIVGKKIIDGTLCPKGKIYNKATGNCDEQYQKSPARSPARRIEAVKPLKISFVPNPLSVCITDSKTKLTPVQALTVDYFQNVDSLLIVFDTGMGKTLTALTAGECFLKENPESRVIIITQKSLLKTFEKEFDKHGAIANKKKYKSYTYDNILNIEKEGKSIKSTGSLVIVDEAHTLRNACGKKYEAVMKIVTKAKKVLLLTATPFVNGMCDLVPLVNLLNKGYVLIPNTARTKKCVGRKIAKYVGSGDTIGKCNNSINTLNQRDIDNQLGTIRRYLDGKLSYAQKTIGVGSEYPSLDINVNLIPMSAEFLRRYNIAVKTETSDIFSTPEAFYNGYRRAVNKLGGDYFSEKIEYTINLITDSIDNNPYSKNVVFSNWIEFGMNVLIKRLKEQKIKYRIITGQTPADERMKIVKDYNDPLKKINTLVISNAGSMGIDLKRVQKIIVLDPVWNNATLEQIQGRGVRYKSHDDLPPQYRTVTVHLLQLVERSVFLSGLTAESKSGDAILYRFIHLKKNMETQLSKIMSEISILTKYKKMLKLYK